MNQLEYLPGIAGQSVQLDGPSAFVGIAEEMRSREWDYDLGYRDLITATRPARKVDVTFNADYATADYLRRVADADVMARTPGTFVAQKEWKQRGYILASDVDDIHYGRLSTSLKIALLDGAWWRLVKRSFVPEITTPEYRSATGETVTASGASGAPLHALTVDGKAVQDGTPTPSNPVDVQVVAPINLISPRPYNSVVNGITTVAREDGSIVLKGTATADSDYVIQTIGVNDFFLEPGTYTFSVGGLTSGVKFIVSGGGQGNGFPYKELTVNSPSATGVVVDGAKPFNYIQTRVLNGTTVDTVLYPQLEKGSTATPYTPYGSIGLKIGSTITPIDLGGNVLASLPDGTHDELNIDSTGNVVLVKRVGRVVLNGSVSETWTSKNTNTTGKYSYRVVVDNCVNGNIVPATALSNVISDRFPAASDDGDYGTYTCHVGISIRRTNTSELIIYHEGESLADFKTWIASNPTTVFYPYKVIQTIDLGYIDMPAIPLDAQISVTAAVTPTITAEWQISRDAYLDYPHNYEYDYQATSSTADVTPSVLTPSDVYLAVFGPAVNPYVIVGGNRYQVNVTVPSGGYLVVDGRDKTIQLTLADGTVQNVFSSGVRGSGAGGGSYIFERIPAGTSEVTYDGSFGFDLGWYEEEGEPPWSQS